MKQKTIGIISLMTVMLFAFATATLGVGDFVIQNALFDQIFTVNGTSNITFSSGEIYENSTALKDVYWQIATVATPSDGDTTHLSTADQIYDWVIGLGYTAGWDTLDDMVLTEAYIYVGNSSNEPMGVAISGDATITADGTLTLDADIMRDAEIETWDYWNESTGLDDNELSEIKINFNTTCAAGNHLYIDGTNLGCEADDNTEYTADAPLNLTGTVFGLIDCGDTEIYKFNATSEVFECEPDGGGMDDLIDDTTPQLGGNLDVNDFGIDGGGSTNMTIDGTGNFIIVLA